MKYNIRINGEVKTIDCELGSGIFDKNGREIFDRDIVKSIGEVDTTGFVIYTPLAQWYVCFQEKAVELYKIAQKLEVVGRVDEDAKRRFKDTGRAWSPQLHDAYNRLLDMFIERKSPEAICEAALAVAIAAKADNRFEE